MSILRRRLEKIEEKDQMTIVDCGWDQEYAASEGPLKNCDLSNLDKSEGKWI